MRVAKVNLAEIRVRKECITEVRTDIGFSSRQAFEAAVPFHKLNDVIVVRHSNSPINTQNKNAGAKPRAFPCKNVLRISAVNTISNRFRPVDLLIKFTDLPERAANVPDANPACRLS